MTFEMVTFSSVILYVKNLYYFAGEGIDLSEVENEITSWEGAGI